MKKILLFLTSAMLFVFLIPIQANAESEDNPGLNAPIEKLDAEKTLAEEAITNEAFAEESEVLLARLDEINEMDKSDLTSSEKRELRREVRQIDKALTLNSGGAYLSVGALIIVILLLILLL
ncbi:MAG: hypothetical protein R6U86_08615 [Bacteroidales bacterium]